MTPSRRGFLRACSFSGLGVAAASLRPPLARAANPVGLREGRFYKKRPDGTVKCELCPCSPICGKELLKDKRLQTACNGGVLVEGQTCVCNVRTNINGTLYATNYGRAGMLVAEPLEKNPLHHFLPGTRAMTVSAPGCSLACKGCQNWQIALCATDEVQTVDAQPERVLALARQEKCDAIAFTYSEPMMFYEYMYDIAKLAKAAGLKTTVVSGGYVNPEPVRELAKVMDAFSISVKAFDDQTYLAYARGKLSTIQATMKAVRASGRWLEVVVLVIPTVTDDLDAMRGFVRWVKKDLGADTPVHFNRYWPSHKLKNVPQTPVPILEEARAMAGKEGLRYCYVGNLPGHAGANTVCPDCGAVLIRRVGFTIAQNDLAKGACKCGAKIPGVWQKA